MFDTLFLPGYRYLVTKLESQKEKKKSFDTEVYNPVVHTISVFKPKIPRFLIYPAYTKYTPVYNCRFKCFTSNDDFKIKTGPRLRIRVCLSKLSVITGYV